MRPITLAGLALIGIGIAGLALGRFSFTTDQQVIDMGPISASVSRQHSVDVPEIAGVGAVFAGIVLIFIGRRTI